MSLNLVVMAILTQNSLKLRKHRRWVLRLALLVGILACFLWAETIEAKYTIEYGVFGQMGIASASRTVENGKYHINLSAKTTGIARFLSGEREEFFESSGIVKNGLLEPRVYKHRVVRNSQEAQGLQSIKNVQKIKESIYEFDYVKNQITQEKIKSKDGEIYSRTKEVLGYFAHDDLLSLFFNFSSRMQDVENEKTLFAVGANKENGSLHVKYLGANKEGKSYLAILNEPIFASENGALHVSLDSSGLCEKAVLENVILFGDIRAIRED